VILVTRFISFYKSDFSKYVEERIGTIFMPPGVLHNTLFRTDSNWFWLIKFRPSLGIFRWIQWNSCASDWNIKVPLCENKANLIVSIAYKCWIPKITKILQKFHITITLSLIYCINHKVQWEAEIKRKLRYSRMEHKKNKYSNIGLSKFQVKRDLLLYCTILDHHAFWK
jgi:hypothetical protein